MANGQFFMEFPSLKDANGPVGNGLPHANLKLVLLGESGTGKTSISERYCRGKFLEDRINTVGAAFLTKVLYIEGRLVKLHVWDTGGQERYHCMTPMYYRDAHGAIIVYDITRQDSFVKAQAWIKEIEKNTRVTPVLVMVGNKSDLEMEREVPPQVAQEFATRNKMNFFETSAKTGHNIVELFHSLGQGAYTLWTKSATQPRGPLYFNTEEPHHNQKPCCS